MKPLQIWRLVIGFYGTIAWTTCLLSLVGLWIIWTSDFSLVWPVWWFKVITEALVILYINSLRESELFYYRNFGLSPLRLWIAVMAVDITLFLFAVFLVSLFL